MPTLRLPLVGSITNRGVTPSTSKDQLFVNCYPELTVNQFTGKQALSLIKRPGYTTGSSYSGVSAAVQAGAIVNWTASTVSPPPSVGAFINTGGASCSVWNLTSGTKLGGDIANTSSCSALTEGAFSGTAHLIANFYDSGSGNPEQWYYPQSGAWTQVTDGDFPTDVVGTPEVMDGYVFNMTVTGNIWNSDPNSPSAYTAGSFIAANNYPDRGVSVARLGKLIVGFGEKSIEFFENAGNPTGSVLRRIQDGGLQMGAARRIENGGQSLIQWQTVLRAYGTIYWIGTNSDGATIGIFRFKGREPEKISTPAIDKLLSNTGTSIYGFAGTMTLHGQQHIVMVGILSAAQVNWCYSVNTGHWWKLELASGNIWASISTGNSITPTNAFTVFTHSTLTSSQTMSTATQDNGSNFTLTVQTDNIDVDTDRIKQWDKIRVSYDRQSAASNLGIAWSDDDFANYSTALNIDMNTEQSWLTALGSSSRRSWKFTNTANTACRIHAVEIDYTLGM